MKAKKSTRSYLTPPKKPLPKRIWSWSSSQWRKDPRPFISLVITIAIGLIAVFLDLQHGWLFLLWFAIVIGIVFFGSCYFIWNIASIAIILIIERKEAEEWELTLLKYWLKRNLIIAGIWAGFLVFSVLFQPGWAILATANGVVLAFIIMFAESEESPFETGERTADMISKKRN
ncbi:MAG: hypothetical protein ACFFGZ_00060 [Candidatus Thorarchaeota archaeon]